MSEAPLIVVVEDSEEMRDLFDFLLSSEGYRVISRGDAESAFEVIHRERPALVLTDIGLGITSGLDLITRIRSDLPNPPLIIACSGFKDYEAEALRRGAHGFVPKPFDAHGLVAAIAEALAHRAVSAPTAARAHARASALRREAVVAAQEALARLGDKRGELERRCDSTVSWLPRYFGFGGALVALIDQEQLRVLAAHNSRYSAGDALDESAGFCRDVVETSSNLVIADAGRWPPTSAIAHARFFAGVPVTDGKTAIGALCIFDDEPKSFQAEDLALVEAIGRIDSATLGARDGDTAPFWTSSAMVSQAGMRLVIDLELKRSERTRAPLFLLAFQADGAAWLGELEERLGAPRSAAAALDGERYAIVLARPSAEAAMRELGALLQTIRQRANLRGAGMVAVDGGNVAVHTGADLLALAGDLCERACRQGGDDVEAVLIRHEAWQPRPAA